MDRQEVHQSITAIVPAYDEASRIAGVLDVLVSYPRFSEIIVIDDGSTDGTGDVVKRYPVRYMKNELNIGKGRSMDKAVTLAKGEIIFFADADISGLTHQIIDEILNPVLDGGVDMSIGMRNRIIYYIKKILILVPLFGGERALTRELWMIVPEYYKRGFRIEAALNFYSEYYGRGFSYKVFEGLSQTIKEKKYGLLRGLRHRWYLSADVLTAETRLQSSMILSKFRRFFGGFFHPDRPRSR